MDLEYMMCQINDELDGAADYAKKAMEIKPMAPTWTPILLEMAKAEMTHASNLYKMAQEYYGRISAYYGQTIPDHLSKMYSEITDTYTEKSLMVKTLMEM